MFMPREASGPRTILPPASREGTGITREGTGMLGDYELRGQVRELKAIVSGLQAQLGGGAQLGGPSQQKASTVDVDEAGVQLQIVEEKADEEREAEKGQTSSSDPAEAKKGKRWGWLFGR